MDQRTEVTAGGGMLHQNSGGGIVLIGITYNDPMLLHVIARMHYAT
ncbi:MAG: hypothetical protein ACRDQ2_11185 [Gaiellales bacterium]